MLKPLLPTLRLTKAQRQLGIYRSGRDAVIAFQLLLTGLQHVGTHALCALFIYLFVCNFNHPYSSRHCVNSVLIIN
jgi:hypothetical protein